MSPFQLWYLHVGKHYPTMRNRWHREDLRAPWWGDVKDHFFFHEKRAPQLYFRLPLWLKGSVVGVYFTWYAFCQCQCFNYNFGLNAGTPHLQIIITRALARIFSLAELSSRTSLAYYLSYQCTRRVEMSCLFKYNSFRVRKGRFDKCEIYRHRDESYWHVS